MIDFTKLTPAPWEVLKDKESQTLFIPRPNGFPMLLEEDNDPVPLEFAALARNAFDVMMRRRWQAEWWLAEGELFGVDSALTNLPEELQKMRWPDPFTALVEADRWMTEQEDKQS